LSTFSLDFRHTSTKSILPLGGSRPISQHYIYQEKGKSLPENHCLISVLQTHSKLLERLILSILQLKIESLQFLTSKHCGFCQQHFITLQIIRIIYKMFCASESVVTDTALYLGISKAFNRVLCNELYLVFSFL
jgi:hypothetical protein